MGKPPTFKGTMLSCGLRIIICETKTAHRLKALRNGCYLKEWIVWFRNEFVWPRNEFIQVSSLGFVIVVAVFPVGSESL